MDEKELGAAEAPQAEVPRERAPGSVIERAIRAAYDLAAREGLHFGLLVAQGLVILALTRLTGRTEAHETDPEGIAFHKALARLRARLVMAAAREGAKTKEDDRGEEGKD